VDFLQELRRLQRCKKIERLRGGELKLRLQYPAGDDPTTVEVVGPESSISRVTEAVTEPVSVGGGTVAVVSVAGAVALSVGSVVVVSVVAVVSTVAVSVATAVSVPAETAVVSVRMSVG